MNNKSVKKTVLVVDDLPENIDVLSGILSSDYTVRAAVNGLRALKIAQADPQPDIILLDIMMPDMDGYDVCRSLKEDATTAHIPVMFVSAKNEVDDTVLGFKLGAIDYISKPVVPAIVQARVRNAMTLQESQQKLQEALDTTLTGSIELLTDVLSIANPVAFGRSSHLRRSVSLSAKHLGYQNTRNFEIAAMLSQLGCISIPTELLERIYNGEAVSEEEQRLFDAHPQVAYSLLQKIPNLKEAADMIALQNTPLNHQSREDAGNSEVQAGASLLQMAIHLDNLERQQHAKIVVKKSGQKIRLAPQEKLVPLLELTVGMVILDDISTQKGMVLMKAGAVVTTALIERLKGFYNLGSLKGNQFKVRFLDDENKV